MTDRETLAAMLERAGVVSGVASMNYDVEDNTANQIIIGANGGPANRGYNGFHAVFFFDDNGALQSVAIWE